MNRDRYLWDRSGEPDPEIEELEQELGGLRFRGRPLALPAKRSKRATAWLIAAAASLLVAMTALVWLYLSHARERVSSPAPLAGETGTQSKPGNREDGRGPEIENSPKRMAAATADRDRHWSKPDRRSGMTSATQPSPMFPQPPVGFEIGRHIESSQLLLRDFRNLPDRHTAADVSRQRERSRFLLQQNIVLRRNAENAGDLPVEEVLGDLEPFLLDIANLPRHSTENDIAAIKDRIAARGMIATLQVYSTVGASY